MAVRQIEEIDDGDARQRLKLILPDAPQERDETPTVPQKTKPPTREAIDQVMIQVARILGFRLQLLLAFLASAGLTGVAVVEQSATALVAAAMFDLMVFLPVLWVTYKRG